MRIITPLVNFCSRPSETYQNLLAAEHYNYFRQSANLGADYRVNNWMCFNVGYTWAGVSRTDAQGRTATNSPQVGIRLVPTDWLSLMANYTFTARTGNNSVNFITEAGNDVPMTYKFYTGSLLRNNANFIAEVYPVNNVTFSFNYSIYNDNFTDSTFGIQSDRGWSTGADVSWRPHDRLAFSLGYDHQQLQVRELALLGTILGETALIIGDEGPTLTTSDSYDTFVAKADIKLIPKKLNLTVRGSYSFATSNFHNPTMPKLNENYADVRTFLTYQFNEHWAVRGGIYLPAIRHEQQVRTNVDAGNHGGGREWHPVQPDAQYPGWVLQERDGEFGAGIFTVQVLT